MGRKFAGLPLWAWVGIAVVGYYAWTKYRAASQAAQSTTAAQNVLANAYGNITGDPYAGWSSGASSPGQGAAGTSPGSGSGAPGTTTAAATTTTTTTGAAGTVPPITTTIPGAPTPQVDFTSAAQLGAAQQAAEAQGAGMASGTTPWGTWKA